MTYTHSTPHVTAEADDIQTQGIDVLVAQQNARKAENSKPGRDSRRISEIVSSSSVLAKPLSPAANDLPPPLPERQLPEPTSAPRHSLPEPTLAPPADVVRRLPTSTSRDFPNMPRHVWLVRDVFHGGEVIILWGESQAGKTVLLLDLVAAIANGSNWAGHPVTKTKVIYVALEGQIGLRKRFQALEHDQGTGPLDGIHFIFEPCNLAVEADVNALALAALQHGAKFIVIDTLSASIAGKVEENSNSSMAGVIANVQRLTQMTGAAVLIVHHTGNDPSRGARGAYALHANPDVSIQVGISGDERYWRLDKGRDGKLDTGGKFKIEPVTFQPEHEDEPLESIVVRHLEGESAPSAPSSPRTKADERADKALTAIKMHLHLTAFGADSQPTPAVETYDTIRKVVTEAFEDYGSNHRAQYVRDAVQALIDSRRLVREGDNVRLPG